ncbi:glycoside hydrolase family 25 [Clostridium sp. DL-VIII]|uniref:GH25 family lysozyme n=1 Tax=Clostridium sp. DL-VIII TaxID=641107 RepID=UPI00023AFB59|nr:GH25 family lysozyme [Clostridium sp. DL-VIII]EHJ00696.1 glycoside hydrolase family 25 [Clostridium sp. DL-VIII]
MNIKRKLTSFVLALTIILSFGQAASVQAATTNSTTTSGSITVNSSNSVPNPGTPESKPNSINVISKYDTKSINNTGNINITSTIGWKKENGYWYYYKSDNTKVTGWIKPDSNWYYLYDDGKMATGWLNYNGTWYYLNNSGSMATGWKQLNNTWYFLNNSGAMITGVNVIDNITYMFYSSGAMVTGWVQLNNYWYYFNNSGSMATGWILDNGVKYYLYDTGAMAKGWINISGAWYYLKSSGVMATGWVNSGSDYYYLDPSSGTLVTNTTIDGYKIGSDGKRPAATSNGNTGSSPSTSGNSSTTTSSIYKGIDISHYNGDIDFKKVKSAGIQCVYMKATEGTTYIDPSLESYYSGAKSAGLKTGFYHFLVGTSSPETQAQNFYNNIKNKQSDLKPVLDIETSGFDVMDYTMRFINEFNRLSNMDVCIYTYSGFIDNLDNRLAKYSLWEANYYTSFSNLPSNSIWRSRVGQQYTDQGTVDGINGSVDLDQFTQNIFR